MNFFLYGNGQDSNTFSLIFFFFFFFFGCGGTGFPCCLFFLFSYLITDAHSLIPGLFVCLMPCSYFVWRYQSEGCLWMPEAV